MLPATRAALHAALAAFAVGAAGAQPALPYQDAARPTPERVADLLARMTLEEKVGQMTQLDVARLMGSGEWDRGPINPRWADIAFRDVMVGSLISGGDAAPVPNTPESWARFVNDLQRLNLERSRLKIPFVYGIDAVHGFSNVAGAVIFPHNLGLAASFDAALVTKLTASTARTMRAIGPTWAFAPVSDLGRDPRWGRFYETFGEDPALAASLVAASVRGLQSGGLKSGVAATVKHFLGYGLAAGGLDRGDALIPWRALQQTVLPSYAAGIDAGAATVMLNSGSVNGVPVHASHDLATTLLRDRLGFRGVTVTDWEDINKLVTVHHVAANLRDAIRVSVMAGADMAMVPHDVQTFSSTLLDLVRAGDVPRARIDEAVTRILTLKFDLGLFERAAVDPARAASVAGADRALARQAAAETLTLLRDDGALPIPAGARRFLVTGPNADSVANQMGGWTIGWQGVPRGPEQPPAVTVLEGVRAAAPKGSTVAFDDGRDLERVKSAARNAEYTIVVAGETPYAEGPGDNRAIALPAAQAALVRAVAGTGTRVILVLIAGRPLILDAATLAATNAFLMAYLPGTEGGTAVADTLFGRVNPGGHLPFSWPAHLGQLPATYDHTNESATNDASRSGPLYPFGYGLSYSSFRHAAPRVTPDVAANGTLEVSVNVTNAGKLAGDDVVLAFASRPVAGVLWPESRLVGFARVTLKPGETRDVKLQVPASRLAVVPGDAFATGAPVVEPGAYAIRVGDQTASFRVRAP